MRAEPGRLARIGVIAAGGFLPAPVPYHFLVGFLQLEVRGGGVEEQQVNFEVEQVCDLREYLLLQRGPDLQQPVHRPVASLLADRGQVVDVHIAADPLGGGQFGGRRQRPVGGQAEQHSLGGGRIAGPSPPGGAVQAGDHLVDAQPPPQRIEHERAAERP